MHRPALRHRVPKKVRLTDRQHALVAKLREGWALYERVGVSGRCWLERHAVTVTVSTATVRALTKRKVLEHAPSAVAYPTCRWQLTSQMFDTTAREA